VPEAALLGGRERLKYRLTILGGLPGELLKRHGRCMSGSPSLGPLLHVPLIQIHGTDAEHTEHHDSNHTAATPRRNERPHFSHHNLQII